MTSDPAPVRRSLGPVTGSGAPSQSNELERISLALERIASALEGSGQSGIRPGGSRGTLPDRVSTPSPAAGIEEVRIVQIRLVGELELEPDSQRIRIAVERKIQSIDEHVREEVRGAVADASAEKGMDLGWEPLTDGWLVSDPDGFAQVAQQLTDFKIGLHRLAVGQPMESMTTEAGAPEPVALLVGKMTEVADLPAIDRPLVAARRLMQLGGIVVGLATGNPILTSACLKVFAHDELTHALAKALEAGFRHLGAVDGVELHTQEGEPHKLDLYLEMTTSITFEPAEPSPVPSALPEGRVGDFSRPPRPPTWPGAFEPRQQPRTTVWRGDARRPDEDQTRRLRRQPGQLPPDLGTGHSIK